MTLWYPSTRNNLALIQVSEPPRTVVPSRLPDAARTVLGWGVGGGGGGWWVGGESVLLMHGEDVCIRVECGNFF